MTKEIFRDVECWIWFGIVEWFMRGRKRWLIHLQDPRSEAFCFRRLSSPSYVFFVRNIPRAKSIANVTLKSEFVKFLIVPRHCRRFLLPHRSSRSSNKTFLFLENLSRLLRPRNNRLHEEGKKTHSPSTQSITFGYVCARSKSRIPHTSTHTLTVEAIHPEINRKKNEN